MRENWELFPHTNPHRRPHIAHSLDSWNVKLAYVTQLSVHFLQLWKKKRRKTFFSLRFFHSKFSSNRVFECFSSVKIFFAWKKRKVFFFVSNVGRIKINNFWALKLNEGSGKVEKFVNFSWKTLKENSKKKRYLHVKN